jgi:hypothetical protein
MDIPPPALIEPVPVQLAQVQLAQVQLAQAETAPEAPAEPVPTKVDVSRYIPDRASSVTMIVTVTRP